MCRYAPHWGLVKPFMFSEKTLPGLRKDFPRQRPLENYLSGFREVQAYGAVRPQCSVHAPHVIGTQLRAHGAPSLRDTRALL
jgi:hypothetical protein